MTVIGEAFVAIRPDSATFATETTKQLEPAAQQVARDFSKTLASAAVGLGIGRALLGGIEANDEAQKALAQTTNVIRTTGGAANVTADQVTELSERLSDQIAVDDDLIRASANLLLTFTRVRNEVGEGNDVFDRAVALSQDLAAGLGVDASGAAIQLGKALNDPLKGITALSRAGVSFTADQKEQIKTLVETGDILSAQKIILDEIATEFAGSAEAQATSLDRIKLAAGETSEVLGQALEPGLEIVAAVATGAASALASIPAPLQAILVGAGGVAALARPINESITLLRTLGLLQGTVATTTTAATGAVIGQTVAVEADAGATTQLTAAQARGAVVLGASTAATEADTVAKVANAAATESQGIALLSLKSGLGIAAAAFVGVTVAQTGLNNARRAGDEIANSFEDQLLDADSFADLQSRFDQLVEQRNNAVQDFSGGLDWNQNSDLRAAVGSIDPVIEQYDRLGEVIQALADTQGISLDESTRIVLGNTEAVTAALEDGYSPAVAGARAQSADLARQQEETAVTTGDLLDEVNEAVAGAIAYTDSLLDARDALAAIGSEQRRAVDAGVAYRESLRNLAEVGGRVNEQNLTGQERLDAFASSISSGLGDVEAFTQGLIDQGVSASEAALRGQDLVNQLFEVADQAGLTKDEVTFLRGEFGLLPDQVDVEIRTNAAIELERVQALRQALIDVGGAFTGQEGFIDPRFPGGARAAGGSVSAGMAVRYRETGAEAFIPGVDGAMLAADRTGGLATRDDIMRLTTTMQQLAQGGGFGGGTQVTVPIDARGLTAGEVAQLAEASIGWTLSSREDF